MLPLYTRLLAFLWTRKCEESFQKLKDCLISPPVLAYPNFDLPFTLHTDASGDGLGAVLEQEDNGQFHPIAYASRTVSKHEKNYGITELEALESCMGSEAFQALLIWTQVYCLYGPFSVTINVDDTTPFWKTS